jgi:RNA-directed DNA polymerase
MPAEGRGLSSEPTSKVGKGRRLGNLATPTSVQRLQTALHAKAKEESEFRFYAVYDKIYRIDVLEFAYSCWRANKGAPGIDGVTLPGRQSSLLNSRYNFGTIEGKIEWPLVP